MILLARCKRLLLPFPASVYAIAYVYFLDTATCGAPPPQILCPSSQCFCLFSCVLLFGPQAMSPLVLTLAQTLDPPIGSVLGWAFGLMAAPGLLTYLGGGVLLGAVVFVTLAGSRRRRAEMDAAEAAKAESEQRLLPGSV